MRISRARLHLFYTALIRESADQFRTMSVPGNSSPLAAGAPGGKDSVSVLDTTDDLILRVLKELQEGAPSLWSFSLDQVAAWAGLSRREVAGHAGVMASEGYVARDQAFGDTPCYRLCDQGRAWIRLGMASQGVAV